MGLPIKVGDSYSNYEELRSLSIKNAYAYSSNIEISSTVSNAKAFNISLGMRSLATGVQHGRNATINVDCLDGTNSIYSTEYKPEGFKQNIYSPMFTTIYDYGIDDTTGQMYYLKAEDKNGNNLTGFFKIKYRGIGIRVVYTLVVDKMVMNIVVISQRDDNYCYELAAKLYDKYGDEIFEDIFGKF